MSRIDPSVVHGVLPDLVAQMAALGARRVILYGSRARGDHAPRSDIDLAIDAPGLSEGTWRRMEDLAEEADTLHRIDCVHLQAVCGALRSDILRDGRVLYERPA